MRIVHVLIFRKEFRTVGDALQAEARAAIPRWPSRNLLTAEEPPFFVHRSKPNF